MLQTNIVSEMTYNVSMGTLNPTIPYHTMLQTTMRNSFELKRSMVKVTRPITAET